MGEREDLIRMAEEYLVTSIVERLEPVVVDRAENDVVIDMDGRKYVDFFAGIAVVNAGHVNEKVVNAAIEQAKKLVHACTYVYHVPPTIKLAKKLAEIVPGRNMKKTFFSNSGAEAIECAMKVARKFTKKHELIALTHSFHGRTIGTLSITGQWKRKRFDMGPYMPAVSFTPSPYCYRCPFGKQFPDCDFECARYLNNVIDYTTSNNVAALIMEPLQGEGGIIPIPKEYAKIVREILDERDILLIDDEVQTGFGRTGKMFGVEHLDIEPDIVTMAKGIADGFPIAACTTRAEIADSFEPGDHLSTFGGNPVSAAAALANIEFMEEENLPKQAEEKGNYIMKALRDMMSEIKLIGDVRGRGLMIGVELVRDRESKEPAVSEAKRIRQLMREKGYLIGVGGAVGSVLRLQPPLTVTYEHIDGALEALEESLKEVS